MNLPVWLSESLPNGLVVTKNPLSESKYSIKSPHPMSPTRIVVHNTANDASADNEIAYMIRNDLEVSFHFAVDDQKAVQGIGLNQNGWHAGDGSNGIGNRQGIAIEICYSQSGGDRFIKAEQNAVKLIAYLLKEAGWGISQITKHQDYSSKYCPHRTLDLGWQRFLNMCQAELDKLTLIPEPFKVGEVVYNTSDIYLDSTVYQNEVKVELLKYSKSIVNKYYTLNGILWMSLNDSNNVVRSPASWTKELDKFTTLDSSEEDINSLQREIIILKDQLKEKDAIITELTENLARFENANLYKKIE